MRACVTVVGADEPATVTHRPVCDFWLRLRSCQHSSEYTAVTPVSETPVFSTRSGRTWYEPCNFEALDVSALGEGLCASVPTGCRSIATATSMVMRSAAPSFASQHCWHSSTNRNSVVCVMVKLAASSRMQAARCAVLGIELVMFGLWAAAGSRRRSFPSTWGVWETWVP